MKAYWRRATMVLSVSAILYLVAVALILESFLSSPVSPDGAAGAAGETAFLILCASAMLVAAVFGIFRLLVDRPARRLAADLAAVLHGGPGLSQDFSRYGVLVDLARTVDLLASRLIDARGRENQAIATATGAAETAKARLAAILNDLQEGVVVCNARHQVVLYNQNALRALHVGGELGLGRPLFGLVLKEPVLHIFDVLAHRSQTGPQTAPFVTGTADGRTILQGRMSLVRAQGEIEGYVISFTNVTESVQALSRRDALLRRLLVFLRSVVDDARAAGRPRDDPVIGATGDPTDVLAQATADFRALLTGWWPMIDLHSADLFAWVARRMGAGDPVVTPTGLPLWLHADAYSLALALEALIRAVAATTGVGAFDLAAEGDGRFCRILLSWMAREGDADDAREQDALRHWLDRPLSSGLGGMTIADAIGHHSLEAVVITRDAEHSILRIAVPPGREGQEWTAPEDKLPPRPEFFDFDLLAQGDAGMAGKTPLKALTYVVFDTETTGLHPTQGDEVVSLAAVRIVNGRILTGETFNRIVNPGRPIPIQSVAFHGITDEMVTDKPPLSVVLPQFKAYAADAVLVAHNAAFDLKFIRMREAAAGVTFDNTVLDTMLLSSFLDGSTDGQSLDAIADRYGVHVTDRHTALGDSLVTAAVLLRLIDALETRGIVTLDQAMSTLNMTMELHNRGLSLS